MATLKLFKLYTGLEIVGELIDTTDNTFTIKRPYIFNYVPQGQDTYGLSLEVYSLADPDGTHCFMSSAIASVSLTIPIDVDKTYLQQTTGISIISTLK
jgi:hypothetical protein